MADENLDSSAPGSFDQGSDSGSSSASAATDSSYPDASQISAEGDQNTGKQPETPPAQAVPQWNPDEWQLKYHDQVIKPESREKLVALAQQGYSYSQAMEKLNQQRSQYEQQYGSYRQLAEAFQKDPKLASHVSEAIKTYVSQNNAASPQSEAQGGINPMIYSKLNELETFKQEFQNKQADDALKTEVEDLKKSFGDQPWDVDNGEGTLTQRVLKHCLNGEYPSLKAAFKDMMWDSYMTNAQAQALKAQQNQQMQMKRQGIVDGGRPSAGMPPKKNLPGYNPGDSYKDLAARAAAELGA